MIYTLCPVYLLLVYVFKKNFDAKYNFIIESNILIGRIHWTVLIKFDIEETLFSEWMVDGIQFREPLF